MPGSVTSVASLRRAIRVISRVRKLLLRNTTPSNSMNQEGPSRTNFCSGGMSLNNQRSSALFSCLHEEERTQDYVGRPLSEKRRGNIGDDLDRSRPSTDDCNAFAIDRNRWVPCGGVKQVTVERLPSRNIRHGWPAIRSCGENKRPPQRGGSHSDWLAASKWHFSGTSLP